MKKEVILDFRGVKKEFGNKIVLHDINLSLNRGEVFGVIGLSGSGKTTLFKTLVGFFGLEEGDIIYNEGKEDFSLLRHPEIIKNNFGFATQGPSFYPKLTAEENLDHFGALYGIKKGLRQKYINYLLRLVSLDYARDTAAEALSGGMQKRLSIACALIHNPKVLILDEPTADLDPHLRNQTWDIIKNINKQGTTILVSSHFLEEVDLLCDRVGILHNGSVLEVGSPLELKDKYTKNKEVEIETRQKNYDIITKKMKKMKIPIAKVLIKNNKMVVYTPRPEFTLYKILNIIDDMDEELLNLNINKPSLAEVFESLTSKNVRLN